MLNKDADLPGVAGYEKLWLQPLGSLPRVDRYNSFVISLTKKFDKYKQSHKEKWWLSYL